MKRPLVSVIIPAYNSRKYMEETLTSVLQQTFVNFEVIVVDDGSTDGLRDSIFGWCEADSRVRYIYKSNQGVSASRNTGFNHSVGTYVAFLDSDDVWMPNNISSKLSKFESGNFGLVHSDGYLITENSEILPDKMVGREGRLLNDILRWKATQVPGPSSILVKREVLQDVGLFDTGLSTSADHDLFLRVSSRFAIGHVNFPTWKYRLHPSNMHKDIAIMEKDILYVYKKTTANKLFSSYWFKRSCYANMYLILAASWAGDGNNKLRALYFTALALFSHPRAILSLFRRLTKRWF